MSTFFDFKVLQSLIFFSKINQRILKKTNISIKRKFDRLGILIFQDDLSILQNLDSLTHAGYFAIKASSLLKEYVLLTRYLR
jgi:hypothetical protein